MNNSEQKQNKKVPKYSKGDQLWELPLIWRQAFYWTSHWEKWYEHYSFLSASAIPAIKWENQEELTVSARKDLTCLWIGQEDTKINDLQDQSVLNTCIYRKVLLIACSKKQHWITLPGSRLLVSWASFIFLCLHPREKNDRFLPEFWLLLICCFSSKLALLSCLQHWRSRNRIFLPSPSYCLWKCQVLADRLLCLGTCETERLCQGISSLSENWAHVSVFGPK